MLKKTHPKPTYILPLTLIFVDTLAITLAFFCAYTMRDKGIFRQFLEHVQPLSVYLAILPAAILMLLILFAFSSLYEPKQRITKITELYSSIKTITIWALFLMAGSYLLKIDYSRIIVLLFYCFTLFLLFLDAFL
jgi:heme/copper-type cytochrome/quinol oxidase subunit 2